MLPVLQIGPLAIQFPGLILLVGIYLALELAERQAKRHQIPGAKLSTLILISLGVGIVAARLVYAAQNPNLFTGNLLSIFALSPRMFSLPGGLIAGAVSALAYGQRSRLPLWQTLDALVPFAALTMIAVHLANYASGEAYGSASTLPWAVILGGSSRHPSQLYEALAAVFVVLLLWPAWKSRLNTWLFSHPGTRTWLFIILSALARLFLERFRGYSPLVLGEYRQAQVIAWAVLAVSLWFFYYFSDPRKAHEPSPPTSHEHQI